MTFGLETFGGPARRLLGLAALLLGWRPAEFWAATPAELAAILEAWSGGAAASDMDAGALARLKEQFPDGG